SPATGRGRHTDTTRRLASTGNPPPLGYRIQDTPDPVDRERESPRSPGRRARGLLGIAAIGDARPRSSGCSQTTARCDRPPARKGPRAPLRRPTAKGWATRSRRVEILYFIETPSLTGTPAGDMVTFAVGLKMQPQGQIEIRPVE